jgi:hypothetical protein
MSNLWIFTPEGFFSSRKDDWCDDDEVMVRARVYEDLLALADILGMDDPQIIRISHGDYLYRMKVKQSDWNIYCAHAAMNHQENGGIKDTDDTDRFFAYLRIWEIMQALQKMKDAEKRGNRNEIDHRREIFFEMVWPENQYPSYRESLTGVKSKKKKKRNKRKARFVADPMEDFDTSAKVRQRNKKVSIDEYFNDPFYFDKIR